MVCTQVVKENTVQFALSVLTVFVGNAMTMNASEEKSKIVLMDKFSMEIRRDVKHVQVSSELVQHFVMILGLRNVKPHFS